MARLHYNNAIGVLGAALTATGTTVTFRTPPPFATLGLTDYVPLVLDPPVGAASSSAFEIAHLTAYIQGAATGTIARGQEGTAGVAHANGATWTHAPLVGDLPISGVSVMDYGARGDGATDDTAAVQAAVNAASALGTAGQQVVPVVFPAGYEFLLTHVIPQNSVLLSCYGATFVPNVAAMTANMAMFNMQGASPGPASLSHFGISGGTWLGTGTESGDQAVFRTQDTVTLHSQCIDCTFEDMVVINWGNGEVLRIANPISVNVLNNRFSNPDQYQDPAAYNAINLSLGSAATTIGPIIVRGNTVTNSPAAAIALVAGGSWDGPVQLMVTDNVCSGFANAGNGLNSGAIACELDGNAGTGSSRITIANNQITSYGSHGGLILGSGSSGGPLKNFLVTGNRVISNNTYVMLVGGDGTTGTIANNHLYGASAADPVLDNSTNSNVFWTGNRYTDGDVQGRAQLAGGTVTVTTPEIRTADNVLLTRVAPGAAQGHLSVGTITNSTRFVINSSNGSDNGTVYWRIEH